MFLFILHTAFDVQHEKIQPISFVQQEHTWMRIKNVLNSSKLKKISFPLSSIENWFRSVGPFLEYTVLENDVLCVKLFIYTTVVPKLVLILSGRTCNDIYWNSDEVNIFCSVFTFPRSTQISVCRIDLELQLILWKQFVMSNLVFEITSWLKTNLFI